MKKSLQCSCIITLISFLIISLISCGGGGEDSADIPPNEGIIIFNIEWENIPPIPASPRSLSLDIDENIKYVQVDVYREWTVDKPFASKVFEYTTNIYSFSIPVPDDGITSRYYLSIMAKDELNNLLYYGGVKEINIYENHTTDLGAIRARSLIPKLHTPGDGVTIIKGEGGTGINFSWSSITVPCIMWTPIQMRSYQIQISNDSSFFPLLVNEKYIYNLYFPLPTSLSPGKYYWRVRVEPEIWLEPYYSKAPWSHARSFDLVEDTNPRPPYSSNYLLAKAEDSMISIYWDTLSEAESYNIYYSYEPGASKHKYLEKISNIIDSPYIHTGLTNGKTYYYILTSVNDINESCESNEISATPSPWTINDTPKDIKHPLFVSSNHHIAIDSNNNFHSCEGNFEGLKYSTNSSRSWIDYYLEDSTEFESSSIAIDDNNKVHIIYSQGYWYNSSTLKYVTNCTGSWSFYTIDSGWDSKFVIDSNNKIHTCYYSFDGCKYATNSSGVWKIYEVSIDDDYFSLVIDNNDKLHISYFNPFDGDLQYVTNYSGEWINYSIDTEGWVGTNNSITIDSDNKIHISYVDNSTGNLKYATNFSDTWICQIIDSTCNALKTSIGIDSSNKIYILYWNEITYDITHTKYATNSSGVWKTYTLDTEGYHSNIIIDPNDKVLFLGQ